MMVNQNRSGKTFGTLRIMEQMVMNRINGVELPTDVRQIGTIRLQVALYVVSSVRAGKFAPPTTIGQML